MVSLFGGSRFEWASSGQQALVRWRKRGAFLVQQNKKQESEWRGVVGSVRLFSTLPMGEHCIRHTMIHTIAGCRICPFDLGAFLLPQFALHVRKQESHTIACSRLCALLLRRTPYPCARS